MQSSRKLNWHHTQVLVTHHVELVLPGTYYLVRMLDGRIDTQGTVKDLRARGVLDDITHDESVDAHKEEQAVEAAVPADAVTETAEDAPATDAAKKPRKLIEEEKREEGSVKWNIYKTYLKASSVWSQSSERCVIANMSSDRSYWVWGFLTFLIIVNQGLGVGEKVWINVRHPLLSGLGGIRPDTFYRSGAELILIPTNP